VRGSEQTGVDGRSADQVLKEDRCAKIPAGLENDIRVVARINNRTCEEEVQMAIEKRIANFHRKQMCERGELRESDCRCLN